MCRNVYSIMWKVIKKFIVGLGSKKIITPVKVTSIQPDPNSYRQAVKPDKLICTLQNENTKDITVINNLKEKTRRRAKRRFSGKIVKHRVTEKNANSIEFAFFRRSGTSPIRIRLSRPEV